MADRLRHQSVQRTLFGRAVSICIGLSLTSERLYVAHSLHDRVELPPEPDRILREEIVLEHRIDELAVAVVLRGGIRSTCVDHARYLPGRELPLRIPVDERPHLVRVAQAEERRARERTVPNPGPVVVARAGLYGGAVPIDEYVCQHRFQSEGDGPGGGGEVKADPVQIRLPSCRSGARHELVVELRTPRRHVRGGAPPPSMERHRDDNVRRSVRLQVKVVFERAGCIAEVIPHDG